MACDRAEERTRPLSAGLFGMPAGREQDEGETRTVEQRSPGSSPSEDD